MAKNFLERLLGFTDNRADTHYPAERTEANENSRGLTGVARYLQKQAAQEPVLTGVEKYLAKQAAKSQTSTPAAPRQAAPQTSVERYLARQAASPAKEPPPVPKTRVEKYLAKQGLEPAKTELRAASPGKKAAPAAEQASAATETAPEPAPAAAQAASTEAKKEPPAAAPEKAPGTAKKAPKGIIDLYVNADQCQASTGKGTRCKRSNNLQQLQHTVGSQQYIFAVCSQHHNDSFIPHPSVLEGH